MAYVKHLVLSNGIDQINVMSGGATKDLLDAKADKYYIYDYSASVTTGNTGFAPGETLTLSGTDPVSGITFTGTIVADASGNINVGDPVNNFLPDHGTASASTVATVTGSAGSIQVTITSTQIETSPQWLYTNKVDKEAGKGLSSEDYTFAEKTKLAGIENGAEVNVNADWNATSGDAEILNKPTTMTNPYSLTFPDGTTYDGSTAESPTLVESVTGATGLVDNTDPANPIINRDSGKLDTISTYTAGNLVEVNSSGQLQDAGVTSSSFDAAGAAAAVQTNLTSHTGNTSNPHGVTLSQAEVAQGSANLELSGFTVYYGGTGTTDEIATKGDVAAASSALSTHTSDTNNPHDVTLAQAITEQGTTNAQISNFDLYYKGSTAADEVATKGDISDAVSNIGLYMGQVKYGANTIADRDSITGMSTGDKCGVQATQLTYTWDGSAWNADAATSPAAGSYYDLVFWYGTWDGVTHTGDVSAKITYNGTTWDLIVYTDVIVAGSITDTEIGTRTLIDNAANSTLFAVGPNTLTGFLQGIRDNLKAVFNMAAAGIQWVFAPSQVPIIDSQTGYLGMKSTTGNSYAQIVAQAGDAMGTLMNIEVNSADTTGSFSASTAIIATDQNGYGYGL